MYAAHPGPLDGADERANAAAALLAPQRHEVPRQRIRQRAWCPCRCASSARAPAGRPFLGVISGLERAPAWAYAPSLRRLVGALRRGLQQWPQVAVFEPRAHQRPQDTHPPDRDRTSLFVVHELPEDRGHSGWGRRGAGLSRGPCPSGHITHIPGSRRFTRTPAVARCGLPPLILHRDGCDEAILPIAPTRTGEPRTDEFVYNCSQK